MTPLLLLYARSLFNLDMRIAREAWPFSLPLMLVAAVLAALHWPWSGGIVFLVALGVLLFFRIPPYRYEGSDRFVLAPAWGVITRIDEVDVPEISTLPCHRIVTFLSVFDVHVQRSPVAGRVLRTEYTRGKKIAAFRVEAGEVNERRLTVIGCANGDRLAVVQIAGLIARRVVTYLEPNDRIRRGDLIGLIRFGSRVDLIVPAGYEILVEPGQRVRGGETVMARAVGQGDTSA